MFLIDITRPWTRSCTPCLDRKGLLLLMLWSTNLYDRVSFFFFFAMWSVKFIDLDADIIDKPVKTSPYINQQGFGLLLTQSLTFFKI